MLIVALLSVCEQKRRFYSKETNLSKHFDYIVRLYVKSNNTPILDSFVFMHFLKCQWFMAVVHYRDLQLVNLIDFEEIATWYIDVGWVW